MKAIILSLLLACHAHAAIAPARGKSYCESNQSACTLRPGFYSDTKIQPTIPASEEKLKTSKPKQKVIVRATAPVGNLPSYMSTAARTVSAEDEGHVIVAEKQQGATLAGLRSGDVLLAVLDQSIKASSTVPTPIRAQVTAGRFRGAFVLGSATFDRELKRILLGFERLRIPGNDTAYTLKATGLATSGQVGLEGEYHTDEGKYFVAELLSATVAGYADATIQRNQTAFGTYQAEPSLGNAGKQGVVSALSKSVDRFAERERSAPEYTEIEAGREIQIIIQESPTEVNGS